MSKLFEKITINGMQMANRFVRSATWEGMADDTGGVTQSLTDTMVALAKGGVGLIITGHAFVQPEGRAGKWQLGIYEDRLIDGHKSMVDAVHAAGGKIVLQIAHSGIFAPHKVTGMDPLAVSVHDGLPPGRRRELTVADIEGIVSAFGEAAKRARAAGYDGAQIHSAHGYLLSQFLSPLFNFRSDAYGGELENRARIHLEVIRAVRKAAGDDFPLLIKINGTDSEEGGLTAEESAKVGTMLEEAGLDAFEISGGLLTGKADKSPSRPGIRPGEKEAYFRAAAEAYRKAVGKPVFLVGGMRSFEAAEALLKEGLADGISMSRPLIREPGLINRWKSGDRTPATCVSDNLCFKAGFAGKGVYCLTEEREKKRQS